MKNEMSDLALGLTGEYDYKGPYLRVSGEGDTVLRTRIACGAFTALITAAYVVGGLSGAIGKGRIYVMIPYIALAIPVVFLIASLVYAIPFAKKMTPLQYKRGFRRMFVSSWFALGLSILSEILEILFTAIVCPKEERGGELVLIGCLAIMAVLVTVFLSFQKKIPLLSTELEEKKDET